ncbi:MAG TPA: GMC family oxidoreductase N-terminal domain-containing protein [Gaiellaceae bacterium]|nr:GMC family oxidoreductase N-terminal domain-containing protein [Gaiellaceae bacterium]
MHDYVVVGAGSAGCVLAARLTEHPDVTVLLLEAGPRDRKLEIRVPAAFSKLFGTALDWGYATVPQEGLGGRELAFPRGRVLGGCSSTNAMMVLRGHPLDQRAWTAPGWSWADIEPYYRRSADGPFPLAALRDRHPLTGDFLAAAAAAGIPPSADLNGEETGGAGPVPVSQRRGRRWSVADGFLRPALRRPNLTLVTGALATRVRLEDGRATGVSYRLGDREEEAPAAREVLLAGGAINSPQLLLLSGIGPREELERHGIPVAHELPGVGRNLRDHLANGILALTKTGVETLYSAESLQNLGRFLLRRRGPLTSNVAEAAAFVRTDAGLEAPDLELIFAPVLYEEGGAVPPSAHGVTVATVLLQPRSSGKVTLRSADPAEAPLIDPRYLTDPGGDDARVLLAGLRLARRVLAANPLARSIEREYLPGEDATSDAELLEHLREQSQTLYHPVGTCRLGAADDAGAVVDGELRVRGLRDLRVVDASAIPALPRGHTNWPTVMLAERAADLIRGAGAAGAISSSRSRTPIRPA